MFVSRVANIIIEKLGRYIKNVFFLLNNKCQKTVSERDTYFIWFNLLTYIKVVNDPVLQYIV